MNKTDRIVDKSIFENFKREFDRVDGEGTIIPHNTPDKECVEQYTVYNFTTDKFLTKINEIKYVWQDQTIMSMPQQSIEAVITTFINEDLHNIVIVPSRCYMRTHLNMVEWYIEPLFDQAFKL